MPAPVDALLEKVRNLPPTQQAEVESFVDFIAARRQREFDKAAQQLQSVFLRLDALEGEPIGQSEIEAEIDAVRAAQRADRP